MMTASGRSLRHATRWVAVVAIAALVVSSCGGDDGAVDSTPTDTATATATSAAEEATTTTTAAAEETTATITTTTTTTTTTSTTTTTAPTEETTTTAPPAEETTTTAGPAQEAEAALADPGPAAMDAWAIVFDSETGFAEKVAHLENAAQLESTVTAYAETGAQFGGVSLEPTAVSIDGDVATITYNVLFGGSAAYSDLSGEMRLTDGVWVVSRDTFCGFMASARTPCQN